MFKVLSLAAALAILPLSAALAQEPKQAPASPEAALEAAGKVFEARMEGFGTKAEKIAMDRGLSDGERETRIAALWAEYQPDVDAFTKLAAEYAPAIAAGALADIDVEALVSEAMEEAKDELAGAAAIAQGVATNGAWASNDPEHMATYGLVADYALGEVEDAMVEADSAVAAAADAKATVDAHDHGETDGEPDHD